MARAIEKVDVAELYPIWNVLSKELQSRQPDIQLPLKVDFDDCNMGWNDY